MITRVITVTTEMACCRDGQEAYRPLSKPIRAEVTEDDFESSLTVWRDRASEILYDKYSAMANDECAGMGTLTLCYFNLSVINVDEFGQPTIPRFVEEQEEILDEEESMLEEDELPAERREQLIPRYAMRAGKIMKRLRKTISKEIFEKRFGSKPTEQAIARDLQKEREKEYYEQTEREKVEQAKEAEQYEVPEVVIQQLQILQNRMERTQDVDEYNSLKREYDRLVQYYRLTNEE